MPARGEAGGFLRPRVPGSWRLDARNNTFVHMTNRFFLLGALRLVISGGRYLPPEILNTTSTLPSPLAAPSKPMSSAELGLTDRQLDVLALMAQGKSNKQICRELGLAEATVKVHVTAILRTLNVASRAQAIVAVNRLGLAFDAPRPPSMKT